MRFVGFFCVALSVSVIGLQSAARAANTPISVPSSIDSSGKFDVTAKMAAFFAKVPDGSVVNFPRNFRYRMDATLVLDHRHHLTINGNGSTLLAVTPGDAHRSNIRVSNSSYITINHLTVIGAHPHPGTGVAAYVPAKEHQHGFEILGSDHVTLDGVSALKVYGDFVYLGQSGRTWSSNVTVQNSLFSWNGRQGISLVGVRNVLIQNNHITDVRRATFDFEPDGADAGVDNIVVRNNWIGAGRLLFVAAEGLQAVNNVQILGNQLHHQSLQIWVRNGYANRRNNWKIAGNTSDAALGDPNGTAMRIWKVRGVEIAKNVQPFQKGRRMVVAELSHSCNVSVHDNVRPNSVAETRTLAGC
jgi:hypothetical protein